MSSLRGGTARSSAGSAFAFLHFMTLQSAPPLTFSGHQKAVVSIVASKDALFSSSDDSTVKSWNPEVAIV